MQGRLKIETLEQEGLVQAELVALERRFRAGLADPAAGRDLARQIIRLRTALTSYALRQQACASHDHQVAAAPAPTLKPL
jgi:hypothetical protein